MFPQFDPSKMDPKVLMELSRMIQTLPPDMINRMQSLMHNAMAGIDVREDMESFEKSLPPGFREKLMTLMGGQMGAFTGLSPTPAYGASAIPSITEAPIAESSQDMGLRDARMTVLKAVADGRMLPEEAEKILFP